MNCRRCTYLGAYEKNAQVCISQYLVWYEDLGEEYALEVKKNINYRNRWHVINKTSLY